MIKCGILAVAGSVSESKYGPKDSSSSLMGLTTFVLIGTGFWVTIHGFEVGKARTKYSDLAKKDGEKEVDERYGLPNLYAQGTSKHAKAFNCVQRSHQHIYESLPQVCVAALVSCYTYPITSAVLTTIYAVGRYSLSTGYAAAEGDASKRYSSPLAFGTWYGLISLYMLGMLSSVKIMVGDKMY